MVHVSLANLLDQTVEIPLVPAFHMHPGRTKDSPIMQHIVYIINSFPYSSTKRGSVAVNFLDQSWLHFLNQPVVMVT